MADREQIPRIPAAEDLTPSDSYLTLDHLMSSARIQSWTDEKTGRMLIKHFRYLLEIGKFYQHGECNICDHPLDDEYNVAQDQGYAVHRKCREWHGSFPRKAVDKAIKAYKKARKV